MMASSRASSGTGTLDQAGLATTMTASEYKQKPPHCTTYSLHNPKYPGALNIPCMRGRPAHDTLLVRTDPWVGLSSTGKARLYTASTIERGYGSSDARGIGAGATILLWPSFPSLRASCHRCGRHPRAAGGGHMVHILHRAEDAAREIWRM